MHLRLAAASIPLLVLLVPRVAASAPILYSFTGTAVSQIGVYASAGTTSVTGFLTYDSGLTDQTSANWSDFFASSDVPNLPFNDSWEISVTNGSVMQTSANNSRAMSQTHHTLQLFDTTFDDTFHFRATQAQPSDTAFDFWLRDASPSPNPDAIGVGFGNLAGMPWDQPLDLSLFDGTPLGQPSQNRVGFVTVHDGSGAELGALEFTIDTMLLVPEPSTAALLGLGLTLLVCGTRRAP